MSNKGQRHVADRERALSKVRARAEAMVRQNEGEPAGAFQRADGTWFVTSRYDQQGHPVEASELRAESPERSRRAGRK